jgi:hypothetical protein
MLQRDGSEGAEPMKARAKMSAEKPPTVTCPACTCLRARNRKLVEAMKAAVAIGEDGASANSVCNKLRAAIDENDDGN